VVVGGGALGRLYSTLLLSAHGDALELVLVVRDDEAREAIRANGLRAEFCDGSVLEWTRGVAGKRLELAQRLSSVEDGSADLLMLTTKAYHVDEMFAQETVRKIKPDTGLVLPLQNGLFAFELLCSVAPSRRHVLGGVARVYAEQHPDLLHAVRVTNTIHIVEVGPAERENSALDDRVRAIVALFACSSLQNALHKIDARFSSDVVGAAWAKLVTVVPLGLVGAATRVSLDVVARHARALLADCARDVQDVAASQPGITLYAHARDAEDAVNAVLALSDAATPGTTVSLHRDIAAGRPSELESQVGFIVRLADKAGVRLRALDVLYAALVPLDILARKSDAKIS